MVEVVRINKSKYDELCHQVRHLQTLAKIVDRVVEKINSLEESLGNINGDVTNCNQCIAKEECGYANKHNTNTGTDKT